ncbi:MAG: SDR family NAD(P)-dependent oxidoreductase [Pseudotabrizicola sp.]|uniref:SDR family NAD(P)-dependent oxidoreductase n=1 Tax=Pseudotabrizicola sp. TaxID=2939647 RepID=UPI0027260EC0|nr:SDR family NAD(P)-dependent oxidoreductase [Pseudotabrizicola sp.]MDO8882131.1 SDR family NAD(P)-dependent oxidoreductase [Pseudotabrizicola sp.]MDP2079907.1 SDR family NAD(P)-dependent oxidoreductase [Pseudotabrizicola sp.]MDZ7575646.1 SDR family NAD(P)-dependent oxidoreductase [Pseudotabrizicola sp.]
MFAIVTAGPSAIGRALVMALANAGYDVGFTHLNAAALSADLVAAVESTGRRARAWEADAGDEAAVHRLHAEAVDWAGGAPDVLVNNAGIQTWAGLLDLRADQWDAVMHTNLRGTFLNTQAAGRAMVAAGKGGSIVNLGSGCNKLAFPKLVDYTASKGGIEQFTKSAAVELGPHGIRVNCIAPGAIATERTAAEAGDYAGTWSKVTPLRRVGTPEDIAGPLVFLCSEAASFITGQTIWVDGGVFSQATWPYEL